MFKRPRLSAQTFPVNAGLAGFLLLYAASCSGPQEPEQAPPETAEDVAVEELTDTDKPQDSLPAVWSTRELDFPVRSIGIAGGAGSYFAVAYQGGGFQVFDFNGDRITEISDYDINALDVGRYAMISGTPVTFFPGIDSDGDLKIWIYGGGLEEALEYNLKGQSQSAAAGLCAAPPVGQEGILHRLAFWTETRPGTLQVGAIVEQGGELVWEAGEPVEVTGTISSCVFTEDGPVIYQSPIRDSSMLRRMGRETVMTLDDSGAVSALFGDEAPHVYEIKDGITVVVPEEPVAIASTGDARDGGYPGGIIVLGGSIGPEDHRVVLVDPSKLTLSAISIPPSGQ